MTCLPTSGGEYEQDMTLFLLEWAVLCRTPSCQLKSTVALRGLSGRSPTGDGAIGEFSRKRVIVNGFFAPMHCEQ